MKRLITLLFCLLLLSNCGGSSQHNSGLTPMPGGSDLPDEALTEAIDKFIRDRTAPPNSEYDYARTDLNGDGKREGIVLFKLPHTYWCGWDGCGMVIFKAGNKDFTPVSIISNVRGPIHVSADTNKGWRDIILRISGTNIADRNIELEFDGSSYPQSPLLAPTRHQPLHIADTEAFFR